MAPRPRIALGALAIAAGGAVIAWIVFDRLVYEREPARKGEPPSPAGTVQVLAVSGDVERSSGQRGWAPVAIGDRLGAEESIRTGGSSRAELGIGEGSRITVADTTQITVRELTNAVRRFQLARGRIAVDYGHDLERRLRIEDEAGRTVETRQARFGVLATGAMLAVATEAGTVTLTARGAAVEVGAGEQSAARGDRPPSRAEPIPSALLLKVATVAADLDRDACEAVAGTASAASTVAIDGEPVPLREDGRFAVHARRRRGQAEILVTTTDALGRTTHRVVPCRPRPHVKDLSVRWKQ
jgi:hypothetical protein